MEDFGVIEVVGFAWMGRFGPFRSRDTAEIYFFFSHFMTEFCLLSSAWQCGHKDAYIF